MKRPIVLDNEGDLVLAAAAEDIARLVEEDQVLAGEWKAYAADGEVLRFVPRIVPRKLLLWRWHWKVMDVDATGMIASTELREKLIVFLRKLGNKPNDLEAMSLADLVKALELRLGDN